MKQTHTIELVIFDWAGTATDYGSRAPVTVFERTFAQRGLAVTRQEINAPMGMEKKAHIRSMLSAPRAAQLCRDIWGRDWNEDDVEALYQSFEHTLAQVVAEFSQPIPGVPETVAKLRNMGVKIGSTTGYTSDMMTRVLPVAKAGGYSPDCVITPDVTGQSRPSPFMVFECMRRLNVYPPCRVVKVGDTVMDVLEGRNAGAWTIGIVQGSNLMGLSLQEYQAASAQQLEQLRADVTRIYRDAGAHLVIDSIYDLPAAIQTLNGKLAAGEEAAR